MPDTYRAILGKDTALVENYYKKSVLKTEQQKFLEKLLNAEKRTMDKFRIADVACGGGTLSYHLKSVFQNSYFFLYDYNQDAINIAKKINIESNFNYAVENIYSLSIDDNSFDYVFCWQTLSWLDNAQKVLSELIRITKPGGKIYASSLFNLDHDVDLYTKVIDHTRESGQNNLAMNYNTYSCYTIKQWIDNFVQLWIIHKFRMEIDIPSLSTYIPPPPPPTRGIGTYTKKIKGSTERMQISAGMLMNWGILEIHK
jgi:ubiquinone/menaquinone biosynthesis C-methylase UbiE